MTNIYAALEIGTTRTVLAVGESSNGSRLRLTSHAEIPSTGIRKSTIVNVGEATKSINGVLARIERQSPENAGLMLRNAFLVVSGPHVESAKFQTSVPVEGKRVSREEVQELLDSSRDLPLPKNRELLDIVEQDYALDALGGIAAPVGMAGSVLKLNTLHVHADGNRIRDAFTAAEDAHLELRDPQLAVTCAADAVLEDHERKNGVLVLDLGGGSTGYAAYADGYLVTAGVIGVGGDHVTNDIAQAFQTTHAQAEELKRQEASAVMRRIADGDVRVRIQGASSLMDSRTVSRRSLDIVVNARLRELMGVLREKLDAADLVARLHSGVVLTGGGAALRDIDTLIQRELGLKVRVGRPIHIDGLEDVSAPAGFAAVAGALQYAHLHYEEKPLLPKFLRKIFT